MIVDRWILRKEMAFKGLVIWEEEICTSIWVEMEDQLNFS